MIQRYGNNTFRQLSGVDNFFGTEPYKEILQELGTINKISTGREQITLPHYSYLKIAEGCNRHCSFCAIPDIRGKYKSRPIEDLTDEARMLAGKGVKEINIIAEDTTYYGLDIYNKQKLVALLDKLVKVDEIEWFRLLYAYPAGFPDDLIDAIANYPKMCKYIDIPLQHISDAILKSMNRGINKEKTYKLIEKLRKQVPGIAIRTSFITGFPGESEQHFNELLEFIKEMKFDRLGIFKYSDEDGTPAYRKKKKIPEKLIEERFDILMQAQQRISLLNNRAKEGKILKTIIDYKKDNNFFGRTMYDAPEIDNAVIIKSSSGKNIEPGKFYDVKITGSSEYDLIGSVL